MVEKETNLEILAHYVQDVRKKRKLSVRKCAKDAGVARLTWTRIESVDVMPEVGTLKRVAETLGVPLKDLFLCLEGVYPTDSSKSFLQNSPEEQISVDDLDWRHPGMGFKDDTLMQTELSLMGNNNLEKLQSFHELAVLVYNPEASNEAKDEARNLIKKHSNDLTDALNLAVESQQEIQLALSLVGHLGMVWEGQKDCSKERSCISFLLESDKIEPRTSERARALKTAGILAGRQMDWSEEKLYFDECLEIWNDLGRYEERPAILNALGMSFWNRDEYESAWHYFDLCLQSARRMDDDHTEAKSLCNLAYIATGLKNFEDSRSMFEQSLTIYEQLSDENQRNNGRAFVTSGLGHVYYGMEEWEKAEAYFNDALKQFYKMNKPLQISGTIEMLAKIQASSNNSALAAIYMGAAEKMREENSFPHGPKERADYERFRSLTQNNLGRDRFKTLRMKGSVESIEALIKYENSRA